MDVPEYIYDGHSWRPCLTGDAGYSFFHAVFGVRDQDDQPYQDKDAKFRRKCWVNFLTYFDNNSVPSCLTDLLIERLALALNRTCGYDEYHEYVKFISQPDYRIGVEDIPFLAVVENARIIVFTNERNSPTIVEPNNELLRLYPLRNTNKLKEIVIYFDGCKFLRMCPLPKLSKRAVPVVPDSVPQKTGYNKLPGNAGIKGSLYQINLLTIFLLNGLKKRHCFRLSTENADSGKFDDLVYERLPTEDAILLQAKHRKKSFKRISHKELFTASPDKDDFSLPKYFFSYQKIKNDFSIQNIVICTNVDLNNKETGGIVERERLSEDHMLHYNGEKSTCYKFNELTLPDLKKGITEYSQIAKDCDDVYSEDDMRDFLEHLQFIANYPSERDLDRVVERILCGMEFCTRFESKDFSKYIIKKMIEWFDEENGGRYLTEMNARALFSEIRSNKFCEKLHNCNIFVKDYSTFPTSLPRILCVASQRGYVLSMIKIYVALHGEQETLFVNPRDDFETQKQVVEAFEVPRYTILVVCLAKAPTAAVEYISSTLTGILEKFSYKKVILICKREDELAKEIKEANEGHYEEIDGNITFNDLTEESQETVLEKVIQFFHAKL